MRIQLVLLFIFPLILTAQPTPHRSVIGIAGNSNAVAGWRLDWTLGEPAVATLAAPGIVLTQGFHQGEIRTTPVREVGETRFRIMAFPVPASTSLNLRLEGASTELGVELLDTGGRRLQQFTWVGTDHQLDLRSRPAGMYLLRFTRAGQYVEHLRFIKTN